MSVVCRWIYKDIACKEQWWAANIRGEEFQCVGRKIFIKSKMLLFSYIFFISAKILKVPTYFLPIFKTFKIHLWIVYKKYKIAQWPSQNHNHGYWVLININLSKLISLLRINIWYFWWIIESTVNLIQWSHLAKILFESFVWF